MVHFKILSLNIILEIFQSLVSRNKSSLKTCLTRVFCGSKALLSNALIRSKTFESWIFVLTWIYSAFHCMVLSFAFLVFFCFVEWMDAWNLWRLSKRFSVRIISWVSCESFWCRSILIEQSRKVLNRNVKRCRVIKLKRIAVIFDWQKRNVALLQILIN